jgi:hypothetical protein
LNKQGVRSNFDKKKNITLRFKVIEIWHLNLKTMDKKRRPSEIYTIKLNNRALHQEYEDLQDVNKNRA